MLPRSISDVFLEESRFVDGKCVRHLDVAPET